MSATEIRSVPPDGTIGQCAVPPDGGAEGRAALVREVVVQHCREAGIKRGLHRAAQWLGVSERWARAARRARPAE